MSYAAPILRTQTELARQMRSRLRDSASKRWSDAEVYASLNDAIEMWAGKVYVPMLYTIANGWSPGIYEYALPSYISQPLTPQRKLLTPYVVEDDSQQFVWTDVLGWEIDVDGAGGQVLRTLYSEGVTGTTNDARILWMAPNGRMPEDLPILLNAAIATTTATSLTCDPAERPEIGINGFVKVDNEWMEYHGYTQTPTVTTLSNLVRGVAGTTAATHLDNAEIVWGVAAPEAGVFQQLIMQARALLFEIVQSLGPGRETEDYRFQMRYWQEQADGWWNKRGMLHAPKIRLGRRAIGAR